MDRINLGNANMCNETGNKFSVDYSKRGTAKCKVCRKSIGKGEIRIGKSAPYKACHIL